MQYQCHHGSEAALVALRDVHDLHPKPPRGVEEFTSSLHLSGVWASIRGRDVFESAT